MSTAPHRGGQKKERKIRKKERKKERKTERKKKTCNSPISDNNRQFEARGTMSVGKREDKQKYSTYHTRRARERTIEPRKRMHEITIIQKSKYNDVYT